MTLTQEQIDERKNYVGGSEAGAILCLNPYDSPYDVWERKVEGKQNNISNAQIYWGNVLEPVIRDEFNMFLQGYNKTIIVKDVFGKCHKKYKFLVGHADGLIFNSDIYIKYNNFEQMMSLEKPNAIVEIKAVSPRMRKYWGEENHDLDFLKHRVDSDKQVPGLMGEKGEIPGYHYAQCAFYMMIYDLDVTYLAAFFGNEYPWQVYKIERDLEFEKWMLETLVDFWNNNVLKGIPPPPQNARDIIKIYPSSEPKKTILATNDIVEASYLLKELKQKDKENKSEIEDLKNELKFFMGNAELIIDIAGSTLNKWIRKDGDGRFY